MRVTFKSFSAGVERYPLADGVLRHSLSTSRCSVHNEHEMICGYTGSLRTVLPESTRPKWWLVSSEIPGVAVLAGGAVHPVPTGPASTETPAGALWQ
jgi:hypothetical protein